MNIKNIFLTNRKILVLYRQIAEKNLLKGKRLIHYPCLLT